MQGAKLATAVEDQCGQGEVGEKGWDINHDKMKELYDQVVELIDYCYRRLIYLNTEARDYAEATNLDKDLSVKDVMSTTPKEELRKKVDEIRFSCAMCSLAVLRYLTDYLNGLDPGVMARLLDTHDVCMSLIPLLEDPPWWRVSNRSRQIESYEDNAWKPLKGDEKLRVNKHAAQIWLALNNLVVDPECRKKVRERQREYLRVRELPI